MAGLVEDLGIRVAPSASSAATWLLVKKWRGTYSIGSASVVQTPVCSESTSIGSCGCIAGFLIFVRLRWSDGSRLRRTRATSSHP